MLLAVAASPQISLLLSLGQTVQHTRTEPARGFAEHDRFFDMPGEQLDLSSPSGMPEAGRPNESSLESAAAGQGGRPFVGVRFACCEVYVRVYVNRGLTAYEGNCPRCGKKVSLRIGPGGTDARFFTAG